MGATIVCSRPYQLCRLGPVVNSVPPRPKAAVMTASRVRSRYPNPPPRRDAGVSGAAEPEAWRAHLAAGLARSPKRLLRTDLTTPSALTIRGGGEVRAPGSSPPWRSSASRARKSFAKPVGCCVALAGARDITPTYAPTVSGLGAWVLWYTLH